MRTIRVTGKGTLQIHPDTTRITMDLEDVDPDYARALEQASESARALKDLVARFGFERTDVKTLSFRADAEYESYREKDEYKKRFIGYKAEHRLKLEFDSDNGLLGRLLYALAHSPLCPEIRISYTVKDPEAAKNELLDRAVRDAAAKAKVLAGAAGLSLGEIQTVDYSWGRVEFETHGVDNLCLDEACASGTGSYNLEIEPDDIRAEDTVTVVWEIR